MKKSEQIDLLLILGFAGLVVTVVPPKWIAIFFSAMLGIP